MTDVNETGVRSHVFAAGDAPATIKTDDPTDYELGTKFQSNAVRLDHRSALLPRRAPTRATPTSGR